MERNSCKYIGYQAYAYKLYMHIKMQIKAYIIYHSTHRLFKLVNVVHSVVFKWTINPVLSFIKHASYFSQLHSYKRHVGV